MGKSSRASPSKQRKLPPMAVELLHDFSQNVSLNPTQDQRMALLSKVRKVAGAAWCTPRTLREYFRNKRDVRAKEMVRNNLAAATRPGRKLDIRKIFGADGHRHAATDPAVHRILWPTLDTGKVKKLADYNQQNTNADEETLDAWSRALRADRGDIANWLELFGSGSWPARLSSPQSESPSAQLSELDTSNDASECLSPLSSLASTAFSSPLTTPPPLYDELEPDRPLARDIPRELAEYVHSRLSHSFSEPYQQDFTTPPLQVFEKLMEENWLFYERIQSGAYASLGLYPTVSNLDGATGMEFGSLCELPLALLATSVGG